MNSKKTFMAMSIRKQVKIIGSVILVLFALLCGLINLSLQQLLYRNEDEHMQVTALRLHDQIELTYEKIANYCINIGEDPVVQAFLQSEHSELFATLNSATECLTHHKVLEPMIEDISLVNESIHYSNVYRNSELDEIRSQVSGVPFCWLGVRNRSFAVDSGKADVMVYAGDVTVKSENIGILSVDASDFFEEGERVQDQMFFLADDGGILFSFSQPTETARDVYQAWKDSGWAEDLETHEYYIRSCYFEKMNCYLVSALNLQETRTRLTQIEILIWSCVLYTAAFCFVFFFLIIKGIVSPIQQFGGAIKQIRQSHQSGLESDLDLKGCAEITELGHEFSGMLNDIEDLNRTVIQSTTDLYKLKVQKQAAELAYLRSQIDPHFLYNTLEVLRKMALEKNAPEIAQMALDMGNIFRYNAKGGDEVSLEEEFSIIKSYMRIQQMRFGNKMEVYYFVSEGRFDKAGPVKEGRPDGPEHK